MDETNRLGTCRKRSDMGIPQSLGKDSVHTLGETISLVRTTMAAPLDFSKAHFLLCDITIKNIHMGLGNTNITDLSLAYLLPDTKKLAQVAAFPAYFSKSQSDVKAGDYYHYKLPVGQSMDAKVGWWVDLNKSSQNRWDSKLFPGTEKTEMLNPLKTLDLQRFKGFFVSPI